MNLATEIDHTDFSYHCKDFEGKEWYSSSMQVHCHQKRLLFGWVLLFGGDDNRFLYPN